MYGLIGKIKVVSGQRDTLIAILLEGSSGMPGCLSYVVAQAPTDADAIWITEVWDSQSSHRASLSLPSVQRAISRGKPLIAGLGERFETKPVGGYGLGTPGAANRLQPLMSNLGARMVVRKLTPTDATAFQSLRLLSLRECPAAFASSYEEECDIELPGIADRLGPRNDRAVFGAFQGHELVGLLGVKREELRKLSHKAYIWGMYVAPTSRRRGIGRQLIAEALSFASSELRVRQVSLGVNAENEAAIALYERMGFKSFGREPCFMLVNGIAQDEIQMACVLHAAP
jgi:ribosomal protein S18 acetylase RimI-like enzyme